MTTPTRRLFLLDSIAYVAPECEGQVIVSGSHGGASAGGFVVKQAGLPHAVFFNDAGVGKDGAGIAGLEMLQEKGVAGAAYSHLSARIGDAADGLASGVVTHANAAARKAGVEAGMTVKEAVVRLGAGT
jgi:hypothetical protein